jgi:fatty acid desaturase
MVGRYIGYRSRAANDPGGSQEKTMLWTITIILFVLWLLGMVSGYTLGSWIHVLLVLAIIVLIFNLLSGRRAV